MFYLNHYKKNAFNFMRNKSIEYEQHFFNDILEVKKIIKDDVIVYADKNAFYHVFLNFDDYIDSVEEWDF